MTNFHDLSSALHVAIESTIAALRPPVMGAALPEATRASLQARLDGLLEKETLLFTPNQPIAPSLPIGEDFYQRQWRQHMDVLQAAIDVVQKNQAFFGGRPGDDAIKIIGDFFVRWAREKLHCADPHKELRDQWAPGQKWETRVRHDGLVSPWVYVGGEPQWHPDQEYRRVEG